MIARAGTGWQTLMADLSIILFMVTASALSQAGDGSATRLPQPSPRAEPLAVWRSEADAPPIDKWLAGQSLDSRQQLSIVAHYAPEKGAAGQQAALAEASLLLSSAGAAGRQARLVVEPGPGGIVATLAYDHSAGLARGLLAEALTPQPKAEQP